MNQPPSNFNSEESTNGFQPLQAETTSQDNNENLSAENIFVRKKQLKRIILILMGLGISLGLLLSVGVVILLNKLGLTKKPYELKQQKRQPIEQIRY